ncbi:MAG TPA: hypothetical protein VKX17_08185 [Planctomycetota bacterium]|nr:hypothetical protein [Planctomycetota bacterium]
MAGYTSTIKAKCWKVHTCLLCGSTYRYKLERSRKGQAPSAQVAQERAARLVQKALETEVDQRPCPHCGLVQPEMVGQSKKKTHGCLAVLSLIALGTLSVFTGAYALTWITIMYIALGVAGAIALIHTVTAIRNPNASLQNNLNRASNEVSKGVTQLIQPGSGEKPATVPISQSGAGLAIALLLVGVLLPAAAELKRMTAGAARNDDWYPPVAGPGDTSRYYLGQSISSIKGLWSGSVQVTAANASELGLEPADQFEATSENDTWQSSMYVKDSEASRSSSLYTDVTFPNNPKLAGQTTRLAIALNASYPAMYQGSSFTTQVTKASSAVSITLASPGAGALYEKMWWFGLAGGMVLQFIAGLIFYAKAKRLLNGLPTQLQPIETANAASA